MKQRNAAFRAAVFTLFGLFLLCLLLINTDTAMDGVRRGLTLCTETLFPSLFPFLVLSELLVAVGAGAALGKWLGRPVGALFGISEGAAVSVLLGAVCGFPVGTTTAISLYERGEISERELRRLVLFVNNPSSGFLVGAVGKALFGSARAGAALFGITLLSAALVGVFARLIFGKAGEGCASPIRGARTLSTKDFTESVRRGFFSLLAVCAFVLFFSCVVACLTSPLEALGAPPIIRAAICGALELISGVSTAVTALPPALAFRAVAFFASFSGLSVALQIFSVADGKGLRLAPYLLAKTAQGAIALLLSECYLRLFRPELTPTESVSAFAAAPCVNLPVAALLLAATAVFFLIRKRRFPKKGTPS